MGDAAVVASLMSPEVSQWLASWPPVVDATYAAQRIADAHEELAAGRALHWLVADRGSLAVMGWIRVTRSEESSARDELGFWFGTALHGAGYATEALRGVLPVAFERLGLATVEAGAQLENRSSVRTLERLGMVPLGIRQVWASSRGRPEACVFDELGRGALPETPHNTAVEPTPWPARAGRGCPHGHAMMRPCGAARRQTVSRQRTPRMQQILVYSDSLTWGIIPNTRERLPFAMRWPGVMEDLLLQSGKTVCAF
jgi:ribosomal-protein-alanine N-acetyltransferase